MTNREKFAEQIMDIACSGNCLAIEKETMKIVPCNGLTCNKCYFRNETANTCAARCQEWCNAEYVEPQIDWSKVPVDTPILVRDSENESWRHRYFAKYENNRVYTWCGGATSWSAENNYASTTGWGYAKLAEESETE